MVERANDRVMNDAPLSWFWRVKRDDHVHGTEHDTTLSTFSQ